MCPCFLSPLIFFKLLWTCLLVLFYSAPLPLNVMLLKFLQTKWFFLIFLSASWKHFFYNFIFIPPERDQRRKADQSSLQSVSYVGFHILLLTTDYCTYGALKNSFVRYKANIKYYFWFQYKEIIRGMGALFTILCRENCQLSQASWWNGG